MWFEYEIGNPDFPEDWVQGLSMYHNPNALIPVDRELFPRIAHHDRTEERFTRSSIPAFHPISSHTPIVVVSNDPNHRKLARIKMIEYCNFMFNESSKMLK